MELNVDSRIERELEPLVAEGRALLVAEGAVDPFEATALGWFDIQAVAFERGGEEGFWRRFEQGAERAFQRAYCAEIASDLTELFDGHDWTVEDEEAFEAFAALLNRKARSLGLRDAIVTVEIEIGGGDGELLANIDGAKAFDMATGEEVPIDINSRIRVRRPGDEGWDIGAMGGAR